MKSKLTEKTMTKKTKLAATVPWAALALALVASIAPGQEWQVRGDEDWCEERRRGPRGKCEARETTLPASGALVVDMGSNGGVEVQGWDRPEVRLVARVRVWKGNELDDVEIRVREDRVRVEGPRNGDWATTLEIAVPRAYDLELGARNGGLSVREVSGRIRLETANGGITISDVGGDVVGRTDNGGLMVTLSGDRWQGNGLDLATRNGGVKMWVPEDYSAELIAGTTNGGLEVGFPVTVQGDIGKRLKTTLGAGGARVEVVTTNGGVQISRSE